MKELRLENFRCYADQSILFRDGINLLIGDNASGKTTVLKACRYVLSSFFSGFGDENTKWLNLDVDDFRQTIVNGTKLPEQPIKIHFRYDSEMYHVLQRNNKSNSRVLISGIAEYKEYAGLLFESFFDSELLAQVLPLPLFAYFSTADIHTSRKIDARKFVKYAQKSSFGYFECLNGNGFLPYWQKRQIALLGDKKDREEIEIVHHAIMKALGEEGCNIIHDIQIRPKQKKIYYILIDGREVEAEELPDAYKRLINIVTDVAFRCALLNRGIYGPSSCTLTCGTVLIDEIDLHLHPSLQALILKALKNTFPKIQFIVTTHAPMVTTGVETNEENVVYKLDYSQSEGYCVELRIEN